MERLRTSKAIFSVRVGLSRLVGNLKRRLFGA